MTSKPVEVRVPITELHYVGWAKSKQMAIDDRPEPMSSLINNPAKVKYEILIDELTFFLRSSHEKHGLDFQEVL